MKRLFFLGCLFYFFPGLSQAATVSGQLTNIFTSGPIAGQMVYFVDSVSTTLVHRDSMLSNASGMYSFNVPTTVTSGYCMVSAKSCGNNFSSAWYSGSSITLNLAIYPGSQNTFSGIIYDNSGAPVSGAEVDIELYPVSVQPAQVWTFTNSSGAYSINVPCNWPYPSNVFLLTSLYPSGGCGITYHYAGANNYKGSSIVINDTLCPVVRWSVAGSVSKQGGGAAANAKVYMISETYDSTLPSSILTVVDSTVTNAAGKYVFVNPNFPQVMHIKAALQSSDPSYWNFLPTYSDSSLLWNGADSLYWIQFGVHGTNVNVSLRGGVNPGGPGFIGGYVVLGANKSTAVGDPLKQRILLLTTATGKAVGYAYSDASGRFTFNNLPYGSYKLFGDAGGKDNPALDITLSAQAPVAGNVIFEENSTSFKGHLNTVAVQNAATLPSVSVFPNPVKDFILIRGLTEDATITLRDVSGKIIPVNAEFRGGEYYISSGNLAAGLYFLQVQAGSGVANLRFVKQ